MDGRVRGLASSPRLGTGPLSQRVPRKWLHGTPVLEENRKSLDRSRDAPRGASLSTAVVEKRRQEEIERTRLQRMGRAAMLAEKAARGRAATERAERRKAAMRAFSEYDVVDGALGLEGANGGEGGAARASAAGIAGQDPSAVGGGGGSGAGAQRAEAEAARKEASRAAELGMMLPQFRESQRRALDLLEGTRRLLDAHPEIRAMRRRERLAALHRRIDAEDFSRGERVRLMRQKRENMAFMMQLRLAEKNMYS